MTKAQDRREGAPKEDAVRDTGTARLTLAIQSVGWYYRRWYHELSFRLPLSNDAA